jgi:hypothetical protein
VRNSASSVPLIRSKEKCHADCTSEKKKVYASAPAARNAASRCGSPTRGHRAAAPGAAVTGRIV